MKKVLLVLVILGLVLLSGGLWWYLNTTGSPFNKSATIPPVQEIEITRDSIAGQILLSTSEGLRLFSPESGEVRSLSDSFDKIQTPTQYWSQTADGQYWLFMTQETVDSSSPAEYETTTGEQSENETANKPTYNWYVVNWPQKLLQSLDETLTAPYLQNKIWHAVAWGEGSIVGGAFVAAEKPDVALQPYTLMTLDLATLSHQEFGVVSAAQLDVIGLTGTGVQTELYTHAIQESENMIIRKAANSLQNTTISDEGGSYLRAEQAHGTQVARYVGEAVQLLDLTDPTEIIGTISPLPGSRIGSAQWWSASGDVFALAHFDTSDTTVQTIVFYSPEGSELFDIEVTGSAEVTFSADGTQAVVTTTSDSLTAASDTTQAVRQYYLVSIFSGEVTPMSTIPENTIRVLGVL